MPQTFTITSIPTDTLKADAKGHAEAVYTVTNTTTRTVRGIARVKPLESTKQDWVKINGESDRDFGPNGTEQYVVTFDAPVAPPPSGGPKPAGSQPPATSATTSPADKYGFQFGVSLQTNPDEDHTEARPVTVELASGPVPTPPKKFPIWIIFVIIAVVLVVAGIVLFIVLKPGSGNGEASPTPTPEATATATPTATPIANFKLPTVANLPEEQAKQALNSACGTPPCVQIDVNRVGDPRVPAGVVVRSDPAEGNEIGVGSRVTLFVSKGSEKVTLINVGNLLEDQARDRLEKACEPAPCVDIEINRIADNRFAAGRVIRTEPAAGTQVQTGSRVQLFISTGPISAPTPTSAALETICFNAVQNQIAWNYQGNKSWSPNNVQDLCRGASMPNPRAPAQCFQRVMHGGISWGGGTQWLWQNARDLCMGTADADRTISCFQRNLRDSMWAEAIRACKSR
jgi:hypothetical protein